MVDEMYTIQTNDGLISKLKEANMSKEDITRIVADLIIAAGDTVYNTTYKYVFISTS